MGVYELSCLEMLMLWSMPWHCFQQENGVKLLELRAVNPEKYALTLLDSLFDDTEMASSCFESSKRSTKPPLPGAKIALLKGITCNRLIVVM